MKWIIKFTFILFSIYACTPHVEGQSSTTSVRQWTIDGVTREALVCIPSTAKSKSTPVIFLFHGHGGNMQEIFKQHNFNKLWPDAIVVSPQGLKTPGQLVDRAGNFSGWQQSPGDQNDRDINFFDAILRTLSAEYTIDKKHIYATGHSNGGAFTYLLWAMRGDVFAATAPSAAVAFKFNDLLKPKPVMHIMGESDPLVKPAWQKKQIATVLTLNQCSTQGETFGKYGLLYPSTLKMPVVVYAHPGKHVYPVEADVDVVNFFKSITHD